MTLPIIELGRVQRVVFDKLICIAGRSQDEWTEAPGCELLLGTRFVTVKVGTARPELVPISRILTVRLAEQPAPSVPEVPDSSHLCPVCKEPFASPQALGSHQRYVHGAAGKGKR